MKPIFFIFVTIIHEINLIRIGSIDLPCEAHKTPILTIRLYAPTVYMVSNIFICNNNLKTNHVLC